MTYSKTIIRFEKMPLRINILFPTVLTLPNLGVLIALDYSWEVAYAHLSEEYALRVNFGKPRLPNGFGVSLVLVAISCN